MRLVRDRLYERMFHKQLFVVILLFAAATQISGGKVTPKTIVGTDIKGRLLTPEEGCGYSKVANTRIVGGAPAKVGAWPWLVLLGKLVNGTRASLTCGGTLITSRHVLSAAHCFIAEKEFVRLAEHDIKSTKDGQHVDIPIDHVDKHENYNNKTKINDIAVVHLSRDVEFTDRISPICLPTRKDLQSRSFVGSTPFLAGFGLIKENGTRANILQQVQIPVISNEDCKNRYKNDGPFQQGANFRFNESYVLCAGYADGSKTPCHGDSGGPMMLPIFENGRFPYYQIGVVAYGYYCGRPNSPGMYTNVQKYIDWIVSKLQ